MSQIKFSSVLNGKNVQIMAGWDRPLKEYFMTIFDLDSNDDDEVIWSSMDDYSDDDQISTKRLRNILNSKNIEVPKGFWEKVELKEGNIFYNF